MHLWSSSHDPLIYHSDLRPAAPLRELNDLLRYHELLALLIGESIKGRYKRSVLYSLNETIPTDQLGALYRSADCFVLSTRGEGWGMPIIEAMACGLPVIATDWSSQCDFMHADNAYPLEVERLVPTDTLSQYYQNMCWAEPSYEHLRQLMRYVFEHRAEAAATGARAAEQIHAQWTWQHSSRRIVERLAKIEV